MIDTWVIPNLDLSSSLYPGETVTIFLKQKNAGVGLVVQKCALFSVILTVNNHITLIPYCKSIITDKLGDLYVASTSKDLF